MGKNFFIEALEELPSWLSDFCLALCNEFRPIDTVGQLGYRWLSPDSDVNTSQGWVLGVYACPTEISGGEADGDLFNPGFGVNLTNVLNLFESVADICWECPTKFNSGLEGPRIHIEGVLTGHKLRLQIFAVAPSDEEASIVLDALTGKSRPK